MIIFNDDKKIIIKKKKDEDTFSFNILLFTSQLSQWSDN